MDKLYHLTIKTISFDNAWDALERSGVEILYGSEEDGNVELYVHVPSLEILSSFDWIAHCSSYILPPIDWNEQWSIHGKNYQNGYVHVDFAPYGKTAHVLKLQPGSGFGDYSHPTTSLMLSLITKCLQNQVVIDIGCGSGILALAAIALGSPFAYGIDIDRHAIEHSQQNALLNQMTKQCTFIESDHFHWKLISEPVLICMNMIQSEQKAAWNSLHALHHQSGICITSGIRMEEKDDYLAAATNNWGWSLLYEESKEGWMGFCFLTSDKKI